MNRIRDAKKSKENILRAAEDEFSEKGFYGSRIDEIASKAGINKRMIYQYFNNKEQLYKTVLYEVYGRLSDTELQIFSKDKSAVESLSEVIELYFDYLRDNPNYISMIMWENFNKGKYIKEIDVKGMKDKTFEMLREVIEKGKKDGIFKKDICTKQVIITILTSTFSYFANKYTLSDIVEINYEDVGELEARKKSVTDMILEYLMK